MDEIIIRWKLNRVLLASKIGMPQGTFNNKLSPNHPTKFSTEERNKLKCVLLELRTGLEVIDDVGFNEALEIIAQQKV